MSNEPVRCYECVNRPINEPCRTCGTVGARGGRVWTSVANEAVVMVVDSADVSSAKEAVAVMWCKTGAIRIIVQPFPAAQKEGGSDG